MKPWPLPAYTTTNHRPLDTRTIGPIPVSYLQGRALGIKLEDRRAKVSFPRRLGCVVKE